MVPIYLDELAKPMSPYEFAGVFGVVTIADIIGWIAWKAFHRLERTLANEGFL